LPGSPKRELREYASLQRKPNRIPSARASGFQAPIATPRSSHRLAPGFGGQRPPLQGRGLAPPSDLAQPRELGSFTQNPNIVFGFAWRASARWY
jgi:hypothetical protein